MSRYDLFRRRIVPIAFFFVLALIAKDACEKGKRTHTTVELQFGAQESLIRAVDVDVVLGDETIASFHRAALPGSMIGPCRFPLSLESDDGELRIDIDLGTTRQRLTRRFHAIEGSTTVVSIPPPR